VVRQKPDQPPAQYQDRRTLCFRYSRGICVVGKEISIKFFKISPRDTVCLVQHLAADCRGGKVKEGVFSPTVETVFFQKKRSVFKAGHTPVLGCYCACELFIGNSAFKRARRPDRQLKIDFGVLFLETCKRTGHMTAAHGDDGIGQPQHDPQRSWPRKASDLGAKAVEPGHQFSYGMVHLFAGRCQPEA
jgi:hypothetical protein